MQSKATTVREYLASLPADRRAAIEAVRAVIRTNLDKTYEEGMQYGMIGYYVPHSVFPPGYHCDPKQPLPFASLASQKNHMAVYVHPLYGDSPLLKWFTDAWAKSGKKLDMGKCCIRFKRAEDLALDVIGEAIRRMPAKKYIAVYQALLGDRAATKARKPAATPKASPARAAKRPATKATRGSKSTGAKKATRRATATSGRRAR